MSPGLLYPCACCREGLPAGLLVLDQGMGGHVCPECRRNGQWATAHMAKLNSEPHAGLPAMPIAISGVYQGSDAPDNHVSAPPPTDQ